MKSFFSSVALTGITCVILASCASSQTSATSSVPTDDLQEIVYCRFDALAGGDATNHPYACVSAIDHVTGDFAKATRDCIVDLRAKVDAATAQGNDYITPEGHVLMESGRSVLSECGIKGDVGNGGANMNMVSLKTIQANNQSGIVDITTVDVLPATVNRFYLTKENGLWKILKSETLNPGAQ